MGWDIVLIVNEEQFVKKYSFIYTLIISSILLAPLYVYVDHKIKLQEIKTEVELKSIQANIIKAMDVFGNHPDETFEFPKFGQYKSGLYKKDFSPIYTQISTHLPAFMSGYYNDGYTRYFITKLPSEKYFFAEYLVTKTKISFSAILLETSVIAFGVVTLILLLSFYFLQSFSQPFKRVNEKLDDFIKESMHEINTPLSIINVNVDLFDSIYGKNKYFSRIKSATKSLATIYNDMDYLIKQNRIEYKDECINLNAFLQDRVSYFKLICELKDIEMSFYYTVKVEILFNPIKLQRIVDNTLSNAIKFSNKNSKIDLSLCNMENNTIKLSVKDYGLGIKNPHKIQDKYYREDEHKHGFGIGMSIVKSIIDESNISLEIKSKLAEGSEFIYIFHTAMIQSVENR